MKTAAPRKGMLAVRNGSGTKVSVNTLLLHSARPRR